MCSTIASIAHGDRAGFLEVTEPTAPFEIDFGTIARGQLASFPVALRDRGNAGFVVAVGTPSAPFAVSTTSVDVAPAGSASFAVTCQSATAGGPHTAAISLVAAGGVGQNTPSLTTRCEIADTDVQVTPTRLDLGELRKDAPAASLEVSVFNPGAAVTLTHLRLSDSRPGLTLTPADTTQVIAPNSMVTATLRLDTSAEVDLAGIDLLVDVGTANLVLPITGKVVTAEARVFPDKLDLGTACLGTPVRGTVSMMNTGTATLAVLRPAMDASRFTTQFQNPTMYPEPPAGARLRAGETATVAVSPAVSATGIIESPLTWDVDAPSAPFAIPVHLEYIDVGTAVSPRLLAFGGIAVASKSGRQTVTFENCNTVPVVLGISGVTAASGDADAWDVQPRVLERTLAPHDKVTLTVAFAPTEPGRHVAQIDIDVDGEPRIVELTGDALGTTLEPTSFYACSCSGPGSPVGGLPIAFAAGLLLRRRRRASSDRLKR